MKHVNTPTKAAEPKNMAIHARYNPLGLVNIDMEYINNIIDTIPITIDGINLVNFFFDKKCISKLIIIFITTIIGSILSSDEYWFIIFIKPVIN
ncbi:hypothetical protein SKB0087_10150 [Anaerococcus nagyae]